MKVIHKLVPEYHLDNYLILGSEVKALSAQWQGNKLALWYEVELNSPTSLKVYETNCSLKVVPTGREVPEDHTYISTVQIGIEVWHVYFKVVNQHYRYNSSSS